MYVFPYGSEICMTVLHISHNFEYQHKLSHGNKFLNYSNLSSNEYFPRLPPPLTPTPYSPLKRLFVILCKSIIMSTQTDLFSVLKLLTFDLIVSQYKSQVVVIQYKSIFLILLKCRMPRNFSHILHKKSFRYFHFQN